MFVLVLFTRDLQSSFISFRREGLDPEGISIRERKFDLRGVFYLRVIFLLPMNGSSSLIGIPFFTLVGVP